ncbi:lysosomal cobalamin transporter-related [Anaeramoeba ignava]|uniref:Lysosomal cobalamin transporter-related n=1 Tax=Anaeramoeba ignava TaxID=1746090 RepID=A0A9Q0RBD9_ANAIG|nr:lysosomal cobalamin transporter-related [Anaeramoeba ignava]
MTAVWLLHVLFSLFSFGLVWFIIRYYSDKLETENLQKVISIFGLFVIQIILWAIPIDIYYGNISEKSTMASFYYGFFVIIFFIIFLFLPMGFFYYNDINLNKKDRIIKALKLSLFISIIGLIVFIIGFWMNRKNPDVDPWMKEIFTQRSPVHFAAEFLIGVLAIFGIIQFLKYTIYGLSMLPISLIKGKQDITIENSQIESQIVIAREKRRIIETKYYALDTPVTKRDQKEIESLKRKERNLERAKNKINEDQQKFLSKVIRFCNPMRKFFGFVFLLFSLFLVISVLLSLIYKITSSSCGSNCGFILNGPTKNPFDLLMVNLSKAFPLDYFVFVAIIVYFIIISLSGMAKIGLRFLWVEISRLRKKSTVPEILILMIATLILIGITMIFEFFYFAPQWATFGSQKNEKGELCSITDIPNCKISGIAIFVYRILSNSFFSVWIWISNLIFVVLYTLILVISLKKPASSNFEYDD